MYAKEKSINQEVVQLKHVAESILEGGNIIVEVDEDDYMEAVEELKFSVIRRLFIHRGETMPTTLELKERLQSIWNIKNLKVIPLGRDLFHILLHSMVDQSLVLAYGTAFTKPGMLITTHWYPSSILIITFKLQL